MSFLVLFRCEKILRLPLTYDILLRRFIFFSLFILICLLFLLSPSLSQSRIFSPLFFWYRRKSSVIVLSKRYNINELFTPCWTTDNFAILRAGCLITFARYSNNANSDCTLDFVFVVRYGWRSICLTRFYTIEQNPFKSR